MKKILRLDLKKIQIATNQLLAYTDAKWNARIVATLLLPMQLYKSLFTEKNGSTQKHSSESINTNKAKTAKTATNLMQKLHSTN